MSGDPLPTNPGSNEPNTGPTGPLNGMMPVIYQELRALAYQLFRAERSDHTLQPTAIVHEAYLRMTAQRKDGWESRAEFIASAIHME